MYLTPREIDTLHVYQAGALARMRRDRGTTLDLSEVQAGKTIVTEAKCMDGARERHSLLQVKATSPRREQAHLVPRPDRGLT